MKENRGDRACVCSLHTALKGRDEGESCVITCVKAPEGRATQRQGWECVC